MAVSEITPAAGAARQADFWKFWVGQVGSSLGSSFTVFALPLLVFTRTGSAIDLAIAGASAALPGLLFGLLIGAWVDRVDRKHLMIATDLLRALAVGSIPALLVLGLLPVEWIYAVSFINATLAVCFTTAQATAIVSLVAQPGLVTANGRLQAGNSAASILGPLLAGALMSVLPLASLLLLDAVSFLGSALALALIRTSFNRLDAPAPARLGAAIREGLAYLFGHPVLRYLALFGLLLNFVAATLGTQLVLFAKEQLHASDTQLGVLFAAQSAGVFAFALLAGRLRAYLPLSRAILGAVVLHGLLTIGLALSPSYWLAAICLAGMAGLVAIMGINVLSLRQAIVPNQLLGRVSSSLSVLIGAATPLGALLGGLAIERTGQVGSIFALIGALICAIGVVFACTPLRRAEDYLTG